MSEVDGERTGWKLRPRALFAIPLAAAAMLAIVWLRSRASVNGMQAVVAASAALDYRPSLARLSADFPYREVTPQKRGADEGDTVPHSASLWALIERLHEEGGERHALGVSYLLVGKPKDARTWLEQALRSATKQRGELVEAIRRSVDGGLLNDLAATYVTLHDASLQSLSLEAVQRSWTLDRTPAAAWTRAVVIDSYHVRECSIAAWHDYLALESRSEWSEFAHRRLNDLQQPTDAELWPAARDRLLSVRNDDPALFRDVDRFRQEVRLWCEEELLPKWGEAVLQENPSAAARLEKIKALGAALEKASDEREIAEAAEAIVHSSGETLRQLAKGHAAYGAGLEAEKHSTVQEATAQMALASAALDPRITPFAWRARMEHAGMLYSSNQYARALDELQQIERQYGARLSIAAGARLQTLLGVTFNNTSSYNEAAAHYAHAAEGYRRIGEHSYEAALLVRLSQVLHRMGEEASAREHLRQGLEVLERTGDSKQRDYAMIVSAFQALEAGQEAQAGLFLDALVEVDTAARDQSRICTSTMWRSAYRYRVGLPKLAEADLAIAENACRTISDRSVRDRQIAFLEVAKAFGADRSTSDSLSGLDEAIGYFEKTNNRIWLSSAYFARARRLARRGDAAEAERDFEAALRETNADREKIADSLRRVSFTATADEITDGYVEFLLDQHRESDAFETSDRRRLRELVDSPTARWRGTGREESLAEIQSAIPSGAALIEYRVLRDRIVAWVVKTDHFDTFALPANAGDVVTAVSDFQSNASFLYDALVRPLERSLGDAKVLVIVPDDELERIAFAALRDAVRGRSLVDTYATAITPSAELFVRSRERWMQRSTRREQVVVVEAATGGADVAALPNAGREAASIARLYRGARVIDGSAISIESLLSEFKEATMLQFAGHTVMAADPSSRALRLGESPQARLGTETIAGAAMPNTRLVYLSACETDSGPVLKSEGSITIARSFFAAGVPIVIGTLWPIEDKAAQLASLAFHERLLAGDTPAESLRQAQLALLRRGVPYRDWASLRLIGAGL